MTISEVYSVVAPVYPTKADFNNVLKSLLVLVFTKGVLVMKKIVLGVVAALTLAGALGAAAVSAHIPPICFCDQYGCVCEQ